MSRPARIRRKDLKRPDEFVTVTTQVLAWSREHQRMLTGVGAVVGVAIVAVSAVIGVRTARVRDANIDLARALAVYREPAKTAEAAKQLAEVSDRWSGTTAGDVAQLLAAATELRRDNVDSALTMLQAAAGREWPPYLKQQLLMTWGAALEKKGQGPDAISKYAEAASVGGPYTFEALLAQAHAQEAAGDKTKAQALYEQIKRDFPDAPDHELIDSKLAAN